MPSLEQQNGKRIAKNTLLLYFRMLITMAVGLYTSRVILKNLGVEDFGVYNIVGGIVAMFSLLTGSLSAAIQRFLTFELGKNDAERLKKVFASSVTIQLFFAVIIVILAEIVGLWFINEKLNVPASRLSAAVYVFHFSVATFAINLISIPYNAAIVAHERMSAFAYVSVFEAFGKLAIAFFITVSPVDKLVFYGFLMCVVAVVVRVIYTIYCKSKFEECRTKLFFDKALLKQIFGFAGWNFIGASSAVFRDQGGNILINLFYGPVVNAARGVAMQVNNAVYQFVNSFTTALNPQITKSYANGNKNYMMQLIFKGSRLSFYMLLILSIPIIVCVNFILHVWLGDVPEYSHIFVVLVILFSLSESISNPLITAMLATGDIRNYQIVVGGLQMLNLPISYLLLKNGCGPEYVFVVAVFVSQSCFFARLIMLQKMIDLPVLSFIKNVYCNVILVAFCSALFPILIKMNVDTLSSIGNCLLIGFSMVCTILSVLYVGCNQEERIIVYEKVKKKLGKLTNVGKC